MNLSVATAAARPCKDSIPRGRVLLDLTILKSANRPCFLTLF